MKNPLRRSKSPHWPSIDRDAGRHRSLVVEHLETRVLLSVSQPGTLNRPADPVVFTGNDVPSLTGIAPDDLVAFRDTGSGWQQVPVQVDERAMVTMYQIYGQTLATPNQTILTYTDPNTFVGADPDPTLDANDEIVFMAKDTGGRVPSSQSAPADVDAASRLEIRVSDPVDVGQAGWVYLFRRTSGAISPGAGVSYVDYQFNLLVGNGDYKTNYNRSNGPNPENSTIETAYYGRHFSDRWVTDELRINAGTGVDLLDRHRFQFAPGVNARTEDTFSNGEGAFVINKSGPVRAIRSWVGANSGPYTQREELYYEQREDVITYLRVHAIPGTMDLFDYNAAANGMYYYNDLNLAGVLVDGNPDTVATGLIQWEMLTGTQGSISQSHVLATNLTGYSATSYYLDDTTPPASDVQVSGDSESWGQGGPWLKNLQSTDAAAGSTNYLTGRRAIYYSGPGLTVADAERNDALTRNPLQAAVDTSTPPDAIVGRQLFYNESGTSTRYDHNDLAINSLDDLAIATDKTAYLWEDAGAATFANVSSYTKGINGIMVDISGSHPNITAADFIFRVGNNNSPGLWTTANAPSSVSVRAGAGVSGSDRVEIIWNGAAAPFGQWLEVITLANANTGLAQKAGYPSGQGDAFFFGNAPGNTGTGDTGSNSLVNSLDEAAIRANNALVSANIPITNVYDVGRNASVNVIDESAARLNGTNPSTTLKYLNLTTAPAAPEAEGVFGDEDGAADVSPLVAGDSGVASALTVTAPTSAPVSLPRWISSRLDSVDLNSGARPSCSSTCTTLTRRAPEPCYKNSMPRPTPWVSTTNCSTNSSPIWDWSRPPAR